MQPHCVDVVQQRVPKHPGQELATQAHLLFWHCKELPQFGHVSGLPQPSVVVPHWAPAPAQSFGAQQSVW